ncbi:hypothetical protein Tco_0267172 [Tanacetum coccineum]
MNYILVVAGTFSNDFAGIQGVSESNTSSQQDQDNQDCIVMPIWKIASYFGVVAPRSVADAQIQDKDGLHNKNDATEKSHDDRSLKDNGTAVQQVNTARPEINTGSREVSTPVLEVNTAAPGMTWRNSYSLNTKRSGFLWIYLKVIEELVQSGYTETRKMKGDYHQKQSKTYLEKPLVQDGDAADVDVPYNIQARCHVCSMCIVQVQVVSPKTSHLLAVKRIFRYLKGKPSLGLWYSKDSPLELVAYTDSDYAGATQDRKSTTGGCQFLGNRLISWQCKKQTVVATSTTEAEYVAAASCCGQVLWIQNQLLDYGYNFMNTVIYIDNNSTICIIENPVQHSKTKHIEIRHHFIRDCNAKKLIQMAKIDTEHNVADLLTKGFDAGRFQYLVSSIGMLNP